MKLLRKELSLTLHPTAVIFLLLSAMLLIPNYPYYVIFFYTSLAIYFTCLSGRENHDIFYTMLLPVSRGELVGARFAAAILLELLQLLAAVPFAVIRQRMPLPPNAVGMDANIALFGFALVMMGLFNLVFFSAYYKDVQKVGRSFVLASTVSFVYIAAAEAAAHAVPFVRDCLDTPEPEYLTQKLAVLAIGAVCFAVMTALSYKRSVKNFAVLDL